MSFSGPTQQTGGKVSTEPYDMNTSISAAANLREAFNSSDILKRSHGQALVMVDSPVLLVPMDEVAADDHATLGTLYNHTFQATPDTSHHTLQTTDVEELGVTAVYAINKDVKTVLADHFQDVTIIPMGLPVWREAYQRAFQPKGRKLFAYFHDDAMEVFGFHQNRFSFHNTFSAMHAHDALYYLLFAWKQLAMDPQHDHLELIGNMPHGEWLQEHLQQHIDIVSHTITCAS